MHHELAGEHLFASHSFVTEDRLSCGNKSVEHRQASSTRAEETRRHAGEIVAVAARRHR